MSIAIPIAAFGICLLILNDLLNEIKTWQTKGLSLAAVIRRLSSMPLFWLYAAACAVCVLFGTRAAPLRTDEGPAFFAIWLVWLSALSAVVKLWAARAE